MVSFSSRENVGLANWLAGSLTRAKALIEGSD
jgi:hypothetical protein